QEERDPRSAEEGRNQEGRRVSRPFAPIRRGAVWPPFFHFRQAPLLVSGSPAAPPPAEPPSPPCRAACRRRTPRRCCRAGAVCQHFAGRASASSARTPEHAGSS